MAKLKTDGATETKEQISREDFLDKAKALTIVIDGTTLTALPRDFSTGSFGWRNNDKITVMIDGKPIKAQIGMNIMVVGSKKTKK